MSSRPASFRPGLRAGARTLAATTQRRAPPHPLNFIFSIDLSVAKWKGSAMLAYIAEIQRLLVHQYGFKSRSDAPWIPESVPDGTYPMEINGKIDRVEIKGGRIFCCNFLHAPKVR